LKTLGLQTVDETVKTIIDRRLLA